MSGRKSRGSRGFIRRSVLLGLLAFLLPVAAFGAFWVVSDEHQVLPGYAGCGWVRERDAQIDCYTSQMRDSIADDGLQATLVAVDEHAADSTTLAADCHLAWHPIGEDAGRADGAAETAFSNISAATSCQQGYAHGYTIGYLEETDPSLTELQEITVIDCREKADDLVQLLNCIHAYGHIIARTAGDDLPAAIRTCETIDYAKLPGASRRGLVPGRRPPVLEGSLHQCLYGMFMEVGFADFAAGNTADDNCSELDGFDVLKACYAYLPARVALMRGGLEQSAASCTKYAPEGEFHESCVKAFSFGLGKIDDCQLLSSTAEITQCVDIFGIRELSDAGLLGDEDMPTATPSPDTPPAAPDTPAV